MKNDDTKLYDLINSREPGAVLQEIMIILGRLDAGNVSACIETVYGEIVRLFNGDYPGYRASNTKYHNLEHTTMVALATARLIHGCVEAGQAFDSKDILLGVLAALFHDSGLIQTDQDRNGTGAKYTIGHEERSIDFMSDNLAQKGFTDQQITDCSRLIQATDLDLDIADIPFRTPRMKVMGKIVGSSDLLAQMADRNYLEKILLLFREFQEAGIPDIESEEQLLRKTEGFYKQVARRRLSVDFDSIADNMRYHFKVRWGIDRDLYQEAIKNNIEYLKHIFNDVKHENRGRLCRYLKRGGIVRGLKKPSRSEPNEH